METLSQPRTRQPFVPADFDELLAQLRSKHVVTESGKIAAVRSTVGLVLDGATVSMVVPGGPAYKAVNGKRIEKGDKVIGIDPDGSEGIRQADEASVIGLLRGADVVGSRLVVQVAKHSSGRIETFALQRADFRSVEYAKDLYLKLAALQTGTKRFSQAFANHWKGGTGKAASTEYLTKLVSESLSEFAGLSSSLPTLVQAFLAHAAVVSEHAQAHIIELETELKRVVSEAHESIKASRAEAESDLEAAESRLKDRDRELDEARAEMRAQAALLTEVGEKLTQAEQKLHDAQAHAHEVSANANFVVRAADERIAAAEAAHAHEVDQLKRRHQDAWRKADSADEESRSLINRLQEQCAGQEAQVARVKQALAYAMSNRTFASLAHAAQLRRLRVELARKEHEVEQLTEQVGSLQATGQEHGRGGALQAVVEASECERLPLYIDTSASDRDREKEEGQEHERALAVGWLQAETREHTHSPPSDALRLAQALAAHALLLPSDGCQEETRTTRPRHHEKQNLDSPPRASIPGPCPHDSSNGSFAGAASARSGVSVDLSSLDYSPIVAAAGAAQTLRAATNNNSNTQYQGTPRSQADPSPHKQRPLEPSCAKGPGGRLPFWNEWELLRGSSEAEHWLSPLSGGRLSAHHVRQDSQSLGNEAAAGGFSESLSRRTWGEVERAGAREAVMAVTTVGPDQVEDDLTRTSPHHVRDSHSLVNACPAGIAGMVLVPPVMQTGDAVTDAEAAEMPVVETEGVAAAMGDALGCSVSPDGLQRALLVKLTAAPDEAREESAAAATDAPSGGNMVIDDDCIVV